MKLLLITLFALAAAVSAMPPRGKPPGRGPPPSPPPPMIDHPDDHTWGPRPDDSSEDADHTGEPPRGNRTEGGRPPMPGMGMMGFGLGRGPRKGRDASGGKGGEGRRETPHPKPFREDHTDHPLRNRTGRPDDSADNSEDHTGEPPVRGNHTDGDRHMGEKGRGPRDVRGGKGGEGRRGTPPPKPFHEDHTDHPLRDRTGGPDASADNSEDHTGEPPVRGKGRGPRDVRGGKGGEGRRGTPPPKPSHEDHTDHPLRDRTGGPDASADEDHTGVPPARGNHNDGDRPMGGKGRGPRDVRGGKGGDGRRGPPPKPSHEDHTDRPIKDRTGRRPDGSADNSADEDHTGRPDHTRGPVEDHTGASVKPGRDGHGGGKGRH